MNQVREKFEEWMKEKAAANDGIEYTLVSVEFLSDFLSLFDGATVVWPGQKRDWFEQKEDELLSAYEQGRKIARELISEAVLEGVSDEPLYEEHEADFCGE